MFCKNHQHAYTKVCTFCHIESHYGEMDLMEPSIQALNVDAPDELEQYQEDTDVQLRRQKVQQGHNLRWKKDTFGSQA